MIVTITQYASLGQDENGNLVPVGGISGGSEARTTAGDFAALSQETNFIRVCGDAAFTLTDPSGDVTYFPANVPEYAGVRGGEVFTLATV